MRCISSGHATFARADVARATVLADFAARESENARLLEDAKIREAERARLSEQIVTAEQDERRRLALFLHDGPVQSMSGIALMLDAVRESVSHRTRCRSWRRRSKQHRETIRALRDLSFNLEPVVLRDQGFGPAVKALAEQLGLEHQLQIDVDVEAAESLGEKRAGRALPDHPRGDVGLDPPRAADADGGHGRPSEPTAACRPRSPTTRRASGGARRSPSSPNAHGRSTRASRSTRTTTTPARRCG